MTRYILRRLGFLALTILVTSLIVFTVTQYLPGDVCRIILGREAGETALETCRADLGLNDPLVVQYAHWLGNFLTGDWGTSYSTKTPIFPLVMGRMRNSLILAGLTLLIAVPVSVLLGVIAGLNENRWSDNAINVASLSVVGLPEFVTGVILIQIFAFSLGWLPANSSVLPEPHSGKRSPC
jgi:peptide/nickel transport system permease protein